MLNHKNPIQVPSGLKVGAEFEADVPGHGLMDVTVPKKSYAGNPQNLNLNRRRCSLNP